MKQHEWKLVAPWYRWERQFTAEGLKPRATRPVFQKFDNTDFVKTFTRDPQRSLRFLDEATDGRIAEDLVHRLAGQSVDKKDFPALVPPGRFTHLYAPRTGGKPAEKGEELSLHKTNLRKLYLPTHKRFYLVVCELHCDEPGFPTTMPDQVCQAGFVVRRRSFQIPPNKQAEAEQILNEISNAQAEIGYWEQTTPARGLKARRRAQDVNKAVADGTYAEKLGKQKTRLQEAVLKLESWRITNGIDLLLEGWFPGPFEHVGAWQPVQATPAEIIESSFPLYHLFPDPNIPNHSAKGKNIYFGVAPATSLDTDATGRARFDDEDTYEIRCFVRRHRPDCPRTGETPDCAGELVWSERTEIYRLATPTD
ncbi:MAG: hypothetical protein ACKV2V_25575, partial [Blastocatellia bacterium]